MIKRSEIISKNVLCSYLVNTRGCCSETEQSLSCHDGCDINQVWSKHTKASCPFWHCLPSTLFVFNSRTVWLINLHSVNVCPHRLQMMRFDFGENRINGLGGVRKCIFFSRKFKMAENLDVLKLISVLGKLCACVSMAWSWLGMRRGIGGRGKNFASNSYGSKVISKTSDNNLTCRWR